MWVLWSCQRVWTVPIPVAPSPSPPGPSETGVPGGERPPVVAADPVFDPPEPSGPPACDPDTWTVVEVRPSSLAPCFVDERACYIDEECLRTYVLGFDPWVEDDRCHRRCAESSCGPGEACTEVYWDGGDYEAYYFVCLGSTQEQPYNQPLNGLDAWVAMDVLPENAEGIGVGAGHLWAVLASGAVWSQPLDGDGLPTGPLAERGAVPDPDASFSVAGDRLWSQDESDIRSAALYLDGTLGPWELAPPLPVAAFSSGSVVSLGERVVLAGVGLSGVSDVLFFGTLGPAGILEAEWEVAFAPQELALQPAVVLDDRLWVVDEDGGLWWADAAGLPNPVWTLASELAVAEDWDRLEPYEQEMVGVCDGFVIVSGLDVLTASVDGAEVGPLLVGPRFDAEVELDVITSVGNRVWGAGEAQLYTTRRVE